MLWSKKTSQRPGRGTHSIQDSKFSAWSEAVGGVTIYLRQVFQPCVDGTALDAVLLMRIAKRKWFSGSNPSVDPSSFGPPWPSGAGLRDNAARLNLPFEVIRLDTKRQRHSTLQVPADGAEGALMS